MNEIDNKYIDWQPIIEYIPDSYKLVILELGCGIGTKFLIDKFKFVYSYETNTRDLQGHWFNLSREAYKNLSWEGFFDTRFPDIKSNVDITMLMAGIKNFVDLDLIDVIFIDPGFKNRAACVIEFANMKKYKYIFTHDTNTHLDLYDWPLLEKIPNCYSLYASIGGQGTKLWKLND